MNRYVKYFDSNNKYTSFLVHDKTFLQKHNETFYKISNLLRKALIVNQCIMVNTLKLK